MKPQGTLRPETTYTGRDVTLVEWVERGAEPYLIDFAALPCIFPDAADQPEVGGSFRWAGSTWRVVDVAPAGLGLVVRRDGQRARLEAGAAGWWAALPGWLRRCLAPVTRLLGYEPDGVLSTWPRV